MCGWGGKEDHDRLITRETFIISEEFLLFQKVIVRKMLVRKATGVNFSSSAFLEGN